MYHLDEKQIQEITDYIFLEDKLEKADAIFIPGCARPEHTEEAARLYKDGYAPLLLPSGGYTKVQGSFQGVSKEGQKYGADFACEADFLEAVLIQNGVPASAILKECEATYTLENAEKTKVLLEKKDIHLKKAILCLQGAPFQKVVSLLLDGISRDRNIGASSSGRWHFQRRLVQDSRREKSCAGGIFENGAAAFDDGRANCMGLIYY